MKDRFAGPLIIIAGRHEFGHSKKLINNHIN